MLTETRSEEEGNLKLEKETLTGDEDMFTWYEVDLDKEMEKQDELADLEWEGYVADKVWQVSNIHVLHSINAVIEIPY